MLALLYVILALVAVFAVTMGVLFLYAFARELWQQIREARQHPIPMQVFWG